VFLIACGGAATPQATAIPDVGPTQTQGALAAQVGTLTTQNAALQATVSAPTATAIATATVPPPTPTPTSTKPPVATVRPTLVPTLAPTPQPVAKVGERVVSRSLAVTINEVRDPLPAGQYMAPKDGFRWVAFDLTVENAGTGPLDYNPFFSRLKTADNREYNPGIILADLDPQLSYGVHQPGESSRG